ncbi:MAG: dihydrofolate synthase [Actinobacteria bacterium]|nr:dihydrofolate synthase [Actinomycetota bacterium]
MRDRSRRARVQTGDLIVGFAEAQAHLDELGVDAMKAMAPSTHRIEAILELLNHPEHSLPALHITGTNGKTSTARIAAGLLGATGLKVGTYTSPHLQSVTERISLGGDHLSEAEFGAVYDHLRPYLGVVEGELEERLTYFELLTAMFFLWAADAVDVVVVEVGLGGRWDATNVVRSSVSVVTNIGLDHTALLGEDRLTIAKEKSGIIKPDSTAVIGELDPGVLAVIRDEAEGVGAAMSLIERDFGVIENNIAVGGRFLSLRSSVREYEELYLPLHGSHQGTNAAVALEAVTRMFPETMLDDDVVGEGLATVKVAGRLESIRPNDEHAPTVVLDVAHNPDGMSALVSSLLGEFAFEGVIFVVGILADKDHVGMLAELARAEGRVVATSARTVRSIEPKEIRDAAEALGLSCEIKDDVDTALDHALRSAAPGEIVCVTGSHYVVGEARTALLP